MKEFNQKQNELQEAINDLIESLELGNTKDTNEGKELVAKTFDAIDGALNDIININYKQCDLQDKWLPHKKEKKQLQEKEDKLFALIDGTIKMLDSFSKKEKEQIKAKEIIKIINKKVALTKDMLDDFWDEALKHEMEKDANDPYWRTKRRVN